MINFFKVALEIFYPIEIPEKESLLPLQQTSISSNSVALRSISYIKSEKSFEEGDDLYSKCSVNIGKLRMPSNKIKKSASERTSYFYYGDGGPKIIDINIVKCFKKGETSVNIY